MTKRAAAKPTITGKRKPFDTNEKRFSVPGFVLRTNCPKCGAPKRGDFASDYLSYPIANKPIDVGVYCYASRGGALCDHGWTVRVVLEIGVRMAKKGEK